VRIVRLFAAALALSLGLAHPTSAAPEFQVIAYHDVRDYVREQVDPDQYAISTRRLIDQFTWLRNNGFTPVSVSDLLAARRGEIELPEKAVLLTFDDGLRSVYTHVYPLLRLFEYPAVVSVVTSWISGESKPDDGAYAVSSEFVTWEELREMHDSGLVEVASHSHNLHQGVPGNPQGNTQPAAITRRYLGTRYETHDEYFTRIRDDLERSASLIHEHLGARPRVMTWPYGAYNQPLVELADELGMPITFTLESEPKSVDELHVVSRHLVTANPEVISLGFDLLYENKPGPIRAAQVDLDYVYDPDPEQQERNLGRLLDRIKALSISHVFLQAFADPDADGGAQALYFPNRHLPMRADLFNRALWQLRTRANVNVYAWLPILSFEGAGIDPGLRVLQEKDGQTGMDPASEPRLSPFSPEAARIISEIYEDLAISAPVDGILFHDDGRLNEFEDVSVHAREAYRSAFGTDLAMANLAENSELARAWARIKTRSIIGLTDRLMTVVERWQPGAMSARNIFSTSLLHRDSEVWLAQDFELFLQSYDHVALMAMPYFENATDVGAFYEDLLSVVTSNELGMKKTIFELQTVDWRTNAVIPATELRETMRWLQARGIRHLAYYPDDFVQGHPELRPLRQGISLAQYPIEVPK
jgi:biofilm PGA synthesis lipoprotein PgaB